MEIVKTIEIKLPYTDNLSARVEIRRVGQQSPDDGDGVIVKATIVLPAVSYSIHPDICFGERLTIAGMALHSRWGHMGACRLGYRYAICERFASEIFVALKWREAEAMAEAWAVGEINKLVAALEARRRALIEADAQ